jgi:hypothetical protein
MIILSRLFRPSGLKKIKGKENSYIKFSYDDIVDEYVYDCESKRWTTTNKKRYQKKFEGFYEGSIFFGTRFSDFIKAESLMDKLQNNDEIIDADKFIIETLGLIMVNDKSKYNGLKRFKNMEIAKKYGFSRMPYFYETENGLISQLEMSSGECMVITILHFVYYMGVRKNYNKNNKLLYLIDEVELALHPSAIDRLINFIKEIVEKTGIICIFSSHSAEVIRKINPKNIYHLENNNGIIDIINPCYPSYAIRDLYKPDGVDFLILVEDDLAKKILDRVITKNNLFLSKLIYVLPCGSWYNNLKLQNDILNNNVLGVGKNIISILDGDVKKDVKELNKFENLKKLFLPIKSIEKYLYEKLINTPDRVFIKKFGDKYFRNRSLNDIINDYKNNYNEDNNGKKLYKMLTSNLHSNGMSEETFLNYFSEDIVNEVDTDTFVSSLKRILNI